MKEQGLNFKETLRDKVWPSGIKCCAIFTFDVDAELIMESDPDIDPRVRRLSLGKYVWRTGAIYRILDLLDKYDIKATFFVPGINALNHPEEIRELSARGHEVACHGWMHEDISKLDQKEEQSRLKRSLEAVEKASGNKPVGYRLAGDEPSGNTMNLIAEEGFLYDSSMRDCDLPYFIELPEKEGIKKRLVEIPSYYEVDDFHLFADYPGVDGYEGRIMSPKAGYEIWTNTFDGYYHYGLCFSTMFHPQIIGKPGYLLLFERLIRYIKGHPHVWTAKARDVAEYWTRKYSS